MVHTSFLRYDHMLWHGTRERKFRPLFLYLPPIVIARPVFKPVVAIRSASKAFSLGDGGTAQAVTDVEKGAVAFLELL